MLQGYPYYGICTAISGGRLLLTLRQPFRHFDHLTVARIYEMVQ